MSTGTLPQGCHGMHAWRMAVWWTLRTPSLRHHVRRECMRSAWLDLSPLMSATACRQRNDVERYRRDN
jgi:hypothetical protein